MARTYLSGSVRVRGGFWVARYRLPTGKDSTKKLGREWTKRGEQPPPGYDTTRSAQRKLDVLLSEYEGWTPGSDPIFKYAAAEFLDHCEKIGLRADTRNRYSGIINHDFIPTLGSKSLSSIEESDIIEIRDDLFERLAPSSVNQAKVVLAGIFKFARKKRKYQGFDASEWYDRAPTKPKTDIDVYSPEELELMARTVQEGKHRVSDPSESVFPRRPLSEYEVTEQKRLNDQMAAILRTAGYVALRLSEIRQLRWRDVDFAGAKITVRRRYTDLDGENDPKSGKVRTVPMASRVAAELERLSRRSFATDLDDCVFCNTFGGRLSGSQIYKDFVATAKAAGVRRLRFHDLRHCAGSLWIQHFDIRTVQEWMGHANIQTTMIYLHYKERGGEAAEMDRLIESRLGPTASLERAMTSEPSAR